MFAVIGGSWVNKLVWSLVLVKAVNFRCLPRHLDKYELKVCTINSGIKWFMQLIKVKR